MEKELFEQLSWISKTYRGRHDERRRYETRYTILTLTVLLAGAAGVTTTDAKLPLTVIPWVYVFTTVLASVASVFLWSIHRANRGDIDRSEEAEAVIRAHFEFEPGSRPAFLRRWTNWALQSLCIVVTSVFVAVFVHTVITASAAQVSPNPAQGTP
jgi:hypothetical protein